MKDLLRQSFSVIFLQLDELGLFEYIDQGGNKKPYQFSFNSTEYVKEKLGRKISCSSIKWKTSEDLADKVSLWLLLKQISWRDLVRVIQGLDERIKGSIKGSISNKEAATIDNIYCFVSVLPCILRCKWYLHVTLINNTSCCCICATLLRKLKIFLF